MYHTTRPLVDILFFIVNQYVSFLVKQVFSESLANTLLCQNNIYFRNVLTDPSFCSCKAEDKTLNLSEPSKVNGVFENSVTKLRPLPVKDSFGLQASFLLVIGIPYISIMILYSL